MPQIKKTQCALASGSRDNLYQADAGKQAFVAIRVDEHAQNAKNATGLDTKTT